MLFGKFALDVFAKDRATYLRVFVYKNVYNKFSCSRLPYHSLYLYLLANCYKQLHTPELENNALFNESIPYYTSEKLELAYLS